MSALTVVQTVSERLGLPRPNAAVSSSDPQIKQILALANEIGQTLASRYNWEHLTHEATFTTVNNESQGDIESLAPGYKFIVNESFHDRTLIRPIFGPVPAQKWQLMKARNLTGPYSNYRIRGGELIVNPVPPAGHTWAFEYISKNWVCDAAETTTRYAFTQDDDYSCIDERLIELGALWRFLAAKGFNYAEEFSEYERQVADAIARDGTKAVLRTGDMVKRVPGVIVSEGSWGAGTWNV